MDDEEEKMGYDEDEDDQNEDMDDEWSAKFNENAYEDEADQYR
jgi:hypothetical protein